MLGWNISVHRQPDGGRSPGTLRMQAGKRLATWQADPHGLDWLNELVEAGDARDLGGDGYPNRYTAQARHLLPVLGASPPASRDVWLHGPADELSSEWAGRTVTDRAAIERVQPDEWLLVEAWDES